MSRGKRRIHHPSAERVRELLIYDSETGVFRGRGRRSQLPAGAIAGSSNGKGYRRVRIDGEWWLLHRLAWLLMTKEWPGELDHIDGNRENNAFVNLRTCTRTQNNANRKPCRSGAKGVYFDVRYRLPWRAQIQKNNTYIYLGSFATESEAHEAYMRAACELFGAFARGK